jgi:hypothetical protein
MKKLLLILLCLPMIGFGQFLTESEDYIPGFLYGYATIDTDPKPEDYLPCFNYPYIAVPDSFYGNTGINSAPTLPIWGYMNVHPSTILFSEVYKKENFPVDTEGRAVLRFSNGTTAYLEWGIGVGYKNEIDLWSEKGSFFTDKIFSKPENYQPIYQTRDINGNVSVDYGDITEQFKEMFYNFYNMFDFPELIETEYDSILERARVMDEIVRFADLNRK